MSFSNLGLAAELLRAVEAQGYTEPTAIQQQAIPHVLSGRDLLASAQTGTGKTAAFMLPLLQRLGADPDFHKDRRPAVLVLVPTRELAAQVAESARDYGRHLKVRTTTIFGGVSIRPQISELQRGVDIVVATPGRLLDHMQQRTIDLRVVKTVVLDEADRMLDMGFIRDIRRILSSLPRERQTLMFSATFSPEIRKLADDFLRDPQEVAATPKNTAAERVEQIVWPVEKARKRELLSHQIGAGNWRQVLVFTRTKHGADKLAKQLIQDGLNAAAIHGNKSQNARTRALAEFKAGKVRVLVATDIAARGLDIERLPHVVNFDLPAVPEDYVHRIGRTARAGEDGQAVSLVSPDEQRELKAIERLLRTSLRREVITGYEGRRMAHAPDRQRPAGEAPRHDAGAPRHQADGERNPHGSGRHAAEGQRDPHGASRRNRGGRGRRRNSAHHGGINARAHNNNGGHSR
jgi:ATP-dependent RNA helicase RhlE